MTGFDIVKLEPWVDWFNIMTYDIRKNTFIALQKMSSKLTLSSQIDGVWDSTVKSIGPYAYAHTNLTEIQLGLELLWRNNINPARVVMGLGFYGRSTLSSLSSFKFCTSLLINSCTSFHNERPQLHDRRL